MCSYKYDAFENTVCNLLRRKYHDTILGGDMSDNYQHIPSMYHAMVAFTNENKLPSIHIYTI